MTDGVALDGAVVLITGGSGGIGAALAAEVRSRGAVAVTADLPGRGADVDIDVTDRTSVAAAAQSVRDDHGPIDVVIANAGIGVAGRLEEVTPEDWDRTIDVNLRGTVHTIEAVYPGMIERGRGSIVLMSSLAGLLGTPLLAPYAASKAAVVGLGRSLRPEAARHGVGVTIVCPGPVETPLLDRPAATAGVDVRRHLVRSAGPALPARKVAALVREAIERDRALVLPGRAALLWRLHRLLPGPVDTIVARNLTTELKATT